MDRLLRRTPWPRPKRFGNPLGLRNRLSNTVWRKSPLDSSSSTDRPFLDLENEELRVQVNTLRYELDNIKQERDLTELRHEKELRDIQLKADSDFRKAQVRKFFEVIFPYERVLC